MPLPASDLRELVSRLADRRASRTEANVQSDLHMLLAAGPLNLADEQLRDIVLESPAGQRRRIDVELGFTVFEVKRDLRVGRVRADAVEQLTGYVADRTAMLKQRYVGVLTDGAEWHLYNLVDGQLVIASSFLVDPSAPDAESLAVWLEGVLATAEKITPTPREIVNRLGVSSPAYALDYLDLTALYEKHRDVPTVKLKRQLWAKLLTTALGTAFADVDDLFVEHTLLVAAAEIISHALVGIDPADSTIAPSILLRGELFNQAQINGVVEQDFFDWIVEVPGGAQFVRTLARRLSRFAWGEVEHDVMKVLYESVISAEQRHSLGEYYTPDWLADEMVSVTVTEPLSQRVLDPSCGSGTFLFHAVRRYLAAAEAAGVKNGDAILGVTGHVTGVDVHPVAVTFARVTYLLAIGMGRLQASDRPAFSVPVYLGDSLQWGQEQTLLNMQELIVPTSDGAQLFPSELRFPESLIADAGRFDQLVTELADKAADRQLGTPAPSLAATFRRFAVRANDQPVLTETFATMCQLHDEGRDHIWGYYVRNLARPVWLSKEDNRVDILIGNPPWLAYRYMTASMQAAFQSMSQARSLWAGGAYATHQDLSGLFVIRCVELYLRPEGRFGFVMPLAALSRRQFTGFRGGRYPAPPPGLGNRLQTTRRPRRQTKVVELLEPVRVAFKTPWDLQAIKPSIFPVPASVVFGSRESEGSAAFPQTVEKWSGHLPVQNVSRAEALPYLSRSTPQEVISTKTGSLYRTRFAAGATVFPRFLFMVEAGRTSALGTGAGRRGVRSQRTSAEKRPWRDLPPLEGVVESQFMRPLYIGETVLPFRLQEPKLAVIPWNGSVLMNGDHDRIDDYPGLATWWRQAERLWEANRSSDRLSLVERLDFMRGLSGQFPPSQYRVAYTASGTYLAAALVADPLAVIEHKLYWATVLSIDEGRYLTAILNSDVLNELVRPLQSVGAFGPRDFDKYIFDLPIPLYSSDATVHRQLVNLATSAEEVSATIELKKGTSFKAARRQIRAVLADAGISASINEKVKLLLSQDTKLRRKQSTAKILIWPANEGPCHKTDTDFARAHPAVQLGVRSRPPGSPANSATCQAWIMQGPQPTAVRRIPQVFGETVARGTRLEASSDSALHRQRQAGP
jgi:SAM-dependent methyltransferase